MAIISTLSTLKSAITDTLHRTDLSAATGGNVEIFIQTAEQRFQRDPRVREPGSNNAVLVSLMTTDPNWLLTAEPDIYLYGALVEACVYLRDDERLAYFEQRLEDAIAGLAGSVRLNPNRTALAVSTYAELQLTIADALNRGDVKNVIPVAVTLAEGKLRNDDRVRNLTSAAYSITADDIAAPAGFHHLDRWYHDGSTYYGAIEIVDAGSLGGLKAQYGASGVPAWAALINGSFRFAPAPSSTFATKMTYFQTITALSAGANWLYTSHPHIYLYASLAEMGPWVQGDDKATAVVMDARASIEPLLDGLNNETWAKQWSGTMRRQFQAIGDC